MSISKVSSAREALFAFRMFLPWLKVPVRCYQTSHPPDSPLRLYH
ncbi:MAG: hypothetical protein ACK56F_27675 [bacterium]